VSFLKKIFGGEVGAEPAEDASDAVAIETLKTPEQQEDEMRLREIAEYIRMLEERLAEPDLDLERKEFINATILLLQSSQQHLELLAEKAPSREKADVRKRVYRSIEENRKSVAILLKK
jgi:predicted metal-dependent hydrolase